MRSALLATGLAVAVAAAVPSHAALARPQAKVFVYRGSGWVLRASYSNASYGMLVHGSISHKGHTFKMLGDWIPAADAGGYLMRFYGPPFPAARFSGLASVATLYQNCIPNCAASTGYVLQAIAFWSLPGTAHLKKVTLKG